MSDCPNSVAATLLFAERQELDLADLINEFSRTLRNIGLDCPVVEADPTPSITLSNDRVRITISYSEARIAAAAMRGVQRPTLPRSSDNAVEQILEVCDCALSVEAAEQPGNLRPVARRVLVAACYHVVRFLDREFEAELIHWHPTDTLFTAEEFETPILPTEHDSQPPRPVLADLAVASVPQPAPLDETAIPVEDAEVLDAVASKAAPVAEPTSARARDAAEPAATAAATTRPSGTSHAERIARSALASEEALRKARRSIFANDLIETEDKSRPQPEKQVGLLEQTTVYVMTSTLMVLSFPIGFAVLIYNILAGENLRATARAMALTGIGFAVTNTDIADRLSSLI